MPIGTGKTRPRWSCLSDQFKQAEAGIGSSKMPASEHRLIAHKGVPIRISTRKSMLRDEGRKATGDLLDAHGGDIGHRSNLDLDALLETP